MYICVSGGCRSKKSSARTTSHYFGREERKRCTQVLLITESVVASRLMNVYFYTVTIRARIYVESRRSESDFEDVSDDDNFRKP